MFRSNWQYVVLQLITFLSPMQTQLQSLLLNLAQQVINGGGKGPQANLHFKSVINQIKNLQQCLSCIGLSYNFTFVYCSNMIKLIQSGQFCIISQTKSEESILNLVDNINNTKLKVYGQIITVLVEVVKARDKPSYMSRTIKDLIAICLKTLFQDNSFFPFLQKTINLFIPYYNLIESFNTTTQTPLQFIEARYNIDYNNLENYCILVQIFSSMFQFLTIQSTSKTYYEYRRSIYVFRNTYLAHFLYFGVENCKILFQNYQDNILMRAVVKTTIEFLERVFIYPFTLSLHEFQIEQDSGDNLSNGSNDLYFPNFFRHVICDINFLQTLYKYALFLINSQEEFDKKRAQIISLIKIIGKAISPSQYTFKNDGEKKLCREFAIKTMQDLTQKYRYVDSYYVNTIIDIVHKMLSIYDVYFAANRDIIIDYMLNFLFTVIQRAELKIDQGKKSLFARTFELLTLFIQSYKEKPLETNSNSVTLKCQGILEKALQRLLSADADKAMSEFGIDQPTEIQFFSELFEFVPVVFENCLQTNLAFMQSINIYNLSPAMVAIWLHLCAQLIPKTSASPLQTIIILKYYELAKNGDSLASLRYIRVFLEEVMSEFRQDQPYNQLWTHIQQISPVSFEEFISSIISICMGNFRRVNNQILSYSLQLFKVIYTALKKFDNKNFERFYSIMRHLLENLEETVFSQPDYYSKRQDFFNIISIIWINSDNLEYTYNIYALISKNLQTGTPQSFFQYLHDITGLLQPLEHHQAFQVMSQLALDDLTKLFLIHMVERNKTIVYLKDPQFIKIFCRLVFALISDINRKLFFQSHTRIPLKIHRVLFPYIKFLTETEEEFEYPKNYAHILQKMIHLNPLREIVSFERIIKPLKQNSSECFDRLVRCYFENIARVVDISWMYDLIADNPDFMLSWWQEAMNRKLHPKKNLQLIAESRFWSTNKQRETFAKLVYELGYYDQSYWDTTSFDSQRHFVEEFTKVFM